MFITVIAGSNKFTFVYLMHIEYHYITSYQKYRIMSRSITRQARRRNASSHLHQLAAPVIIDERYGRYLLIGATIVG